MKVAELTGAWLDYWVGIAANKEVQQKYGVKWSRTFKVIPHSRGQTCWQMLSHRNMRWKPSTDWYIGGPLIERQRIMLDCWPDTAHPSSEHRVWWHASINGTTDVFGEGETPLIAAMRCFVKSKFGDDVPEMPL
jgi:hypothetical protein